MTSPTQEDEDVLTLIFLLLGSSGLILTALGAFILTKWTEAVEWMVSRSLIVTSDGDPTVVLPTAGGAGLDLPRLLVLTLIAAALLFLLGRTAIRRLRGGAA